MLALVLHEPGAESFGVLRDVERETLRDAKPDIVRANYQRVMIVERIFRRFHEGVHRVARHQVWCRETHGFDALGEQAAYVRCRVEPIIETSAGNFGQREGRHVAPPSSRMIFSISDRFR
jgi:hypothetical protein